MLILTLTESLQNQWFTVSADSKQIAFFATRKMSWVLSLCCFHSLAKPARPTQETASRKMGFQWRPVYAHGGAAPQRTEPSVSFLLAGIMVAVQDKTQPRQGEGFLSWIYAVPWVHMALGVVSDSRTTGGCHGHFLAPPVVVFQPGEHSDSSVLLFYLLWAFIVVKESQLMLGGEGEKVSYRETT